MRRALPLLIVALLAASPATAGASLKAQPAGWAKASFRSGEVVVTLKGSSRARLMTTRANETVLQAVARLERDPKVKTAAPNFIARAAAFIPNDPGKPGDPAGAWQNIQWNLSGPAGVNAPQAWENLIKVGRPGGAGVTVAVLDTGVAYRNYRRFRRSPDFSATPFRKGYDFVDNDPYPLDHNGHGTHVASTIAESANNGVGLVGIAYGARIMPVRVLDRLGEGDSVAISNGIRYAARRGAKIINLSFEFSSTVTADQIPDILGALNYARKKGALVIGASGNASASAVAYPAKSRNVLSVGAVTEHGCQAEYSNDGPGLDIAAPGGGADAEIEDPGCNPQAPPGRDIVQMTFDGSIRRFGLPSGYMGTSMAAPHVSATAALIVASGVIGANPTPQQIETRLKQTARDLGRPGPDSRYGAGLVDAAAATTPAPPPPPPPPPA